MARLFTAIELEPAVRASVADAQAVCAQALPDPFFRLVPAAQLHLTLVFVGEIDDRRVPAVTDAMSRELACAPFTLAFGGLGLFPPRGPARVLWIGIEQGRRDVEALFEAVAERLAGVGVSGEDRAFMPHLTIARWRQPNRGARPALPPIDAVGIQRVTSVTLFQSRLGRSGAEHTVLTRAPLAAGAGAVH